MNEVRGEEKKKQGEGTKKGKGDRGENASSYFITGRVVTCGVFLFCTCRSPGAKVCGGLSLFVVRFLWCCATGTKKASTVVKVFSLRYFSFCQPDPFC